MFLTWMLMLKYLKVVLDLLKPQKIFCSLIDYDALTEEQIDAAIELEDMIENIDGDTVEEGLENEMFKTVIRGGKKVKKLVCRKGFKAQHGKCVKMSAAEKIARAKAAKKAAKKPRKKMSTAARAKLSKSLKKAAKL